MCCMSGVKDQVSSIRCQVSGVPCHIYIFFYKVYELFGEGSVINGAYTVKFLSNLIILEVFVR